MKEGVSKHFLSCSPSYIKKFIATNSIFKKDVFGLKLQSSTILGDWLMIFSFFVEFNFENYGTGKL